MANISIDGQGRLCKDGRPQYFKKNGRTLPIMVGGYKQPREANAVLPAETPLGFNEKVRVELPSQIGNEKAYTVTLLNTSAEEQNTVLGDGLGLITDSLNYGALNGVVVVDGSKGATSLGILKLLSQQSAMRITKIHYQGLRVNLVDGGTAGNTGTGTPAAPADYSVSENSGIFNGDNFRTAVAPDVTSSINSAPIVLSNKTDGDTFDKTIRTTDRNFRFIIDPFAGLPVSIPAFSGVTMTISYTSLGKGHSMQLV